EIRLRRVRADRLGARGLVDADGADGPVPLGEDVAADPPDVVGDPLAFLRGAGLRGLELDGVPPAAAPEDDVRLHHAFAQLTSGFHIWNSPSGLCFQIQTWSE